MRCVLRIDHVEPLADPFLATANHHAINRRAQRAPVRAAALTVDLRQIWPAAGLLYMTILPPEVSFEVLSLTFYAYRLFLFAIAPAIFVRLTKGAVRLMWIDWVILLGSVCIPISVGINNSLEDALGSGAPVAVDLILAHLAIRTSVRNGDEFRGLLAAFAPGLLLAGLSVAFESVTHLQVVRPAFAAIFSPAMNTYEMSYEIRLGLLRGYGVFSHPILAGLQLATFFPLYWMGMPCGTPRNLGIVASALAFFALSSAALLSLTLSIGLLVYHRLQARIQPISWNRFLFVIASMLLVIHIGSQNGIVSIVTRYLTLSSGSAYYRQYIWEYGMENVYANPWFGLGMNDWIRPAWMVNNTIDAHWLYLAMKYGIPLLASQLVTAIAVIVGLGLGARRLSQSLPGELRVGMAISLTVLCLMLLTVTFYGTALIHLYVMVASGLALSTSAPAARPVKRPKRAPMQAGDRMTATRA